MVDQVNSLLIGCFLKILVQPKFSADRSEMLTDPDYD